MSSKHPTPPLHSKAKCYTDWLKLLAIWEILTDVDKKKQAPLVLLSLEGEAQEAALRVKTDDLTKYDGLKKIIAELDIIYKKDVTINKYNAIEKFESYRRPADVNIRKYLLEFQRRMDKTTELGTEWGDDILAYRLLKNANLSEQNEQLAKATIETLTYEKVKEKLKSIFGDSVDPPACNSTDIKTENIDFAGSLEWQDEFNAQFNENCNLEDEQTFYFSSRNQQKPQQYNQDYNRNYNPARQNSGQYNNNQFNNNNQSNSSSRDRGQRTMFNKQAPRSNYYPQRGNYNPRFQRGTYSQRGYHNKSGRNPLDTNNQVSHCAICHSINHWAQHCPDASSKTILFEESEEITLFESDLDDGNLSKLVAQTLNAAVIDCGASKTCCGSN